MTSYLVRHFLRHWRMNLILLLGLTLAAALLASLPSYAATVAFQTLTRQLSSETPASRNIEVRGPLNVFTGALYNQVMDIFTSADFADSLLVERLELKTLTMDELVTISAVDGGGRLSAQYATIWSMDHLRNIATVVEGDWPTYEPPHTAEEIQRAMMEIPPVEAAVSARVAADSGIHVGDRIRVGSDYTFNVVAILQPVDPQADVWWGDRSQLFLTITPGPNEDTIGLPLLVAPQVFQELLTPDDITWRIVLDSQRIRPEFVQSLEQTIIELKTDLASSGAQVFSNLPNFLLAYRENLSTLRMVLLLLGIQAYIFVLYCLALITSASLESIRGEMAVLAGRGGSSSQILYPLTLEVFLLATIAGGVLGPLLAQGFLQTWGWLSGHYVPGIMPIEARHLALLGAGVGWLIISLAAYPAARHTVLEWQQRLARPLQYAGWQTRYFDFFLLVASFVVYWQLSSSGSFILTRLRQTDAADPLLMLGPSLLMLTLAIVGLRLFPYVLQMLAWVVRSSRGLVLALGLARLARAPLRPAQVILLVSLACGLVFFTNTYNHSLEIAEADIAHYQVGADLRLSMFRQPLEAFSSLPGVLHATPVFRGTAQSLSGRSLTILAVDSATFANVSSYPPGLKVLPLESVMAAIRPETITSPGGQAEGGVNPFPDDNPAHNLVSAVSSFGSLQADQTMGSSSQISLPPYIVFLKINGRISHFPTVSEPFIVLDLAALQGNMELDFSGYYPKSEVWLDIDPLAYDTLMQTPLVQDNLLADARADMFAIQNNAFISGIQRAFSLNSISLSILSVVGLFIQNYFSARQRTYELSILRANGISTGQLLLLMVGEGLMIIFIGLLVGSGIGYGLSQVMRNYLNLPLGHILTGLSVYRIEVDWLALLWQYAGLLACYLLAILLSLLMLLRVGVHRVLRIGDE